MNIRDTEVIDPFSESPGLRHIFQKADSINNFGQYCIFKVQFGRRNGI